MPLPNASFEVWSGDTPDGWTRFAAIAPEACTTSNTLRPADDAFEGKRSLEFTGDTSTCSWLSVVSSRFEVKPGQVYRLEGSMKTIAVDTARRRFANIQILMVAFDPAGKRVTTPAHRV